MANKRMFSQDVVSTDTFIDMPPSARALYFELGMYADDDGFVQPKGVMRMYGHSDDDMRILVARGYVHHFDTGVIVIKHWKQNNYIRADRYKPTLYREELAQLSEDDNLVYQLSTMRLPLGDEMSPQ